MFDIQVVVGLKEQRFAIRKPTEGFYRRERTEKSLGRKDILTFYIQNPRTIDRPFDGIEDDFLRLCLCHPCRQLQIGVIARSSEMALKIQPRILQHKFTPGSLASPIRVIEPAQTAHLAVTDP
jgi:hypothetical protein